MINSLKKYMVVDLLILIIIGCLIDFFGIKFGGIVLASAPMTIISLLITIIAVTRWNLWGLLVCPFLALFTILGGSNIEVGYLRATYDWHLGVSLLIGHLSIGFNVIFYKKIGTKKVIGSPYVIFLILLDYILFCTLQFITYRLLTSGTLLHSGLYEYTYTYVNQNKETITETKNICKFGEAGFVTNLFGLAVAILGVYVSRSQGILCNVKQKFIDDRENAKLMKEDENFRIDDSVEVSKDESSNEKDSNLEEQKGKK